MPRRTNPFQQVIARVYLDLSDDAEESKLLRDRKAHTDREVDVVITEEVAGERIRVGVETTAPKRKADLPTVDKLLGKHADLDTHHVIIVGRSGFTGPAKRKIDETHNASGYQPRDLTDKVGLESKIVGQLAAIWQKRFSVTLTDTFVFFDLPERFQGTNVVDLVSAAPDFPLVNSGLQEVASPGALFMEWANNNGQEIGELLDVQNIAENTKKTLLKDLLPPWRLSGEETGDLFIMINTNIDRGDPRPEPLRVKRLDVRGPATVLVNRVDLQHQRLHAGIAYSVGETEIDGAPMLVVVSYTTKGEKISTLRRA